MRKWASIFFLIIPSIGLLGQPGLPVDTLIAAAARKGTADTAAADKMFRRIIADAVAAGDDYHAGRAFYEMGEMYYRHGNHNRSFGAFFNARNHFHESGSKKEIAHTLFGLGREQYFRGNYKVAASHLNLAIRQAQELKIPRLEAASLEYLGLLYHVMPTMTNQSAALLRKSLSIKQKLSDKPGELRMLQKLGTVYFEQAGYDSALYFYDRALQLAGFLRLKHDADLTRLDRAGTLTRLRRFNEAENELQGVARQSDTNDVNIRIRYYYQQGNYLVTAGRRAEGEQAYKRALTVADSASMPELYAILFRNMAETYRLQGWYAEAYEYLRQYNAQLSAVFSKENIEAIRELDYIFNTSLTKEELASANQENKIKEIQLKNERQLRSLLLWGLGILLLLLLVIFYFYQKQRQKTIIIDRQAEDLRTLMKEVDHRVKNNLQIISSLLDLQSMIIKDNQAAQAVKEGRNRVQSMALIHQILYRERSMQGIRVDEYINNLAESLFHSYNIKPGQVELKADIEQLSLDVDTVIPIGLVLNELISNSLKYAFSDAGGLIEVKLGREQELLLLKVRDNGKGFPDGAEPAKSSSFGMRMIRAFSQKLKADLEIYNEGGACVMMRIRKFKLA